MPIGGRVPTYVFEGPNRRVQLTVFDFSDGPARDKEWPTSFRVRSLPLNAPKSQSYASGNPECNGPDFRKAWTAVERIRGCRTPVPDALAKYAIPTSDSGGAK